MLNVLEFSLLRLIINVGRLGLSSFGEEHEQSCSSQFLFIYFNICF